MTSTILKEAAEITALPSVDDYEKSSGAYSTYFSFDKGSSPSDRANPLQTVSGGVPPSKWRLVFIYSR